MRDSEAPLARHADEPAVPQQRAEDHLELDRVRRHPAKHQLGILCHVKWIGPTLRLAPEVTARYAGAFRKTRASRPRRRPKAARGSVRFAARSPRPRAGPR